MNFKQALAQRFLHEQALDIQQEYFVEGQRVAEIAKDFPQWRRSKNMRLALTVIALVAVDVLSQVGLFTFDQADEQRRLLQRLFEKLKPDNLPWPPQMEELSDQDEMAILELASRYNAGHTALLLTLHRLDPAREWLRRRVVLKSLEHRVWTIDDLTTEQREELAVHLRTLAVFADQAL